MNKKLFLIFIIYSYLRMFDKSPFKDLTPELSELQFLSKVEGGLVTINPVCK